MGGPERLRLPMNALAVIFHGQVNQPDCSSQAELLQVANALTSPAGHHDRRIPGTRLCMSMSRLGACATVGATVRGVEQALSLSLTGQLYRRADALAADRALEPDRFRVNLSGLKSFCLRGLFTSEVGLTSNDHTLGRPVACRTQRRLRRRQTGHRHAERAAGHVIQADLLAERDRGRDRRRVRRKSPA